MGQVFCTSCGTANDDAAVRCGECDQPLTMTEMRPGTKPEPTACPWCAEAIPDTATRCRYCGLGLTRIELRRASSITGLVLTIIASLWLLWLLAIWFAGRRGSAEPWEWFLTMSAVFVGVLLARA